MVSDLSVFHRIDDPDSLECSRFFGLAELLPFYDGAVRARLAAAMASGVTGADPVPAGTGQPHPMLAGLIPPGESVTYVGIDGKAG